MGLAKRVFEELSSADPPPRSMVLQPNPIARRLARYEQKMSQLLEEVLSASKAGEDEITERRLTQRYEEVVLLAATAICLEKSADFLERAAPSRFLRTNVNYWDRMEVLVEQNEEQLPTDDLFDIAFSHQMGIALRLLPIDSNHDRCCQKGCE